MRIKKTVLFLSIFTATLACSEPPEQVLTIDLPIREQPQRDAGHSLETPERLDAGEEVPWALPEMIDIPDETFLVWEFARQLARGPALGESMESLFELAQRSAPLKVFIELPMYGKEVPLLYGTFDRFENFARCLHGQVELGLCGTSEELEVALFEHRGLVEEELRDCVDGCCHFSYRDPVEEMLTLRQVCFDALDDGRLAIRELTLAAP